MERQYSDMTIEELIDHALKYSSRISETDAVIELSQRVLSAQRALDAERERVRKNLLTIMDVQAQLRQVEGERDEREKVAQLSEENNNLVVELAELRETVTDLKCSFHGRLSTAQTDLAQLQALLRALPVVEVDGVIVWEAPDESGWFVSKRPAPTGTYWAKFKTQEDAKSFLALLQYRASLDPTPVPREEGKE